MNVFQTSPNKYSIEQKTIILSVLLLIIVFDDIITRQCVVSMVKVTVLKHGGVGVM